MNLLCLLASTLPTQPHFEFEPSLAELSRGIGSSIETVSFAPYTPAVPLATEYPELEYTYIEANYIWTDSDDLDDTLDGWEATGSLELPLNFFLQASVSDQSADADVSTYRIGAGWHFGFTSLLDAYGILSFAHVEVDNSPSDFSDDGMAGELGLRFMLTRKLELNGRGQWVDIEDSEAGYGVGARWYITESLSLGANIDEIDNDEVVSAGVRLEF